MTFPIVVVALKWFIVGVLFLLVALELLLQVLDMNERGGKKRSLVHHFNNQRRSRKRARMYRKRKIQNFEDDVVRVQNEAKPAWMRGDTTKSENDKQ